MADYGAIGRKARELTRALTKGSSANIKTPGSSLKLELTGVLDVDDGVVDQQDIANDSNICYIPPGFVYAEVAPESVSGTFTISPTVTRFGMVADGTIELRDGEVASAKSRGSRAAMGKVEEAASKNKRGDFYHSRLEPPPEVWLRTECQLCGCHRGPRPGRKLHRQVGNARGEREDAREPRAGLGSAHHNYDLLRRARRDSQFSLTNP